MLWRPTCSRRSVAFSFQAAATPSRLGLRSRGPHVLRLTTASPRRLAPIGRTALAVPCRPLRSSRFLAVPGRALEPESSTCYSSRALVHSTWEQPGVSCGTSSRIGRGPWSVPPRRRTPRNHRGGAASGSRGSGGRVRRPSRPKRSRASSGQRFRRGLPLVLAASSSVVLCFVSIRWISR